MDYVLGTMYYIGCIKWTMYWVPCIILGVLSGLCIGYHVLYWVCVCVCVCVCCVCVCVCVCSWECTTLLHVQT